MPASAPMTDDLEVLLRQRGGRVTPQRLTILRELRRAPRHATAQEVHEAVRAELPGVSLPTVYATLELLAELRLVRKLAVRSGTALYDARCEPHHHTVCHGCGAVADLDDRLEVTELLETVRATGFTPDAAELVVSGLCRRCSGRTHR